MTLTATDVRHRIEDALRAFPTLLTILDGTEEAITADMLPAARVETGATQSRQALSFKIRTLTRAYQIVVYVVPMTQSQTYLQRTDLDTVESWLDRLGRHFRDHPIADVRYVETVSKDEPVITQWVNSTFGAVVEELHVTYDVEA